MKNTSEQLLSFAENELIDKEAIRRAVLKSVPDKQKTPVCIKIRRNPPSVPKRDFGTDEIAFTSLLVFSLCYFTSEIVDIVFIQNRKQFADQIIR